MSFVGKVLVGLQLVLSVTLMAFAAAVSTFQTNWKAERDKIQTSLTKTQGDLRQAETSLKDATDKFNVDLKAESDRADMLQAQLTTAQTTVDTLKAENQSLRETSARETQVAQATTEDDIARQNEAVQLRELVTKTQEDRDTEYNAKAKLEDEIFNQRSKMERLTTQVKDLLKTNAQYRQVLLSNGLPLELDTLRKTQTPPEKVFGEVLEVHKLNEREVMVEISLGENDSLQVGHTLVIYRLGDKNKYLGKIRVQDVNADRAVCSVIQENGVIKKGDHVATKLN